MATTLVSVEEYLHTIYEPDAEYIDGVIEERPMGEARHSEWQATIVMFFRVRRHEWGIRVRPEMRTKTGERRYRVPDIAILDAALPDLPIAEAPPLIAFEVLSPEDRISRLVKRLADFEAMGVQAIYVIDPKDNSLLRFQDRRLEEVETVQLRGLSVRFEDILAELD